MLDNAKSLAAERGPSIETRCTRRKTFPILLPPMTCAPPGRRTHFSNRESFLSEVTRVRNRVAISSSSTAVFRMVSDRGGVDSRAGEIARPKSRSGSCRQTPGRSLAAAINCTSCVAKTTPSQQPDLNWYFDTAGTSAENRKRVLERSRHAAPEPARRVFRIAEEDGKIVVVVDRLALLAQKMSAAPGV